MLSLLITAMRHIRVNICMYQVSTMIQRLLQQSCSAKENLLQQSCSAKENLLQQSCSEKEKRPQGESCTGMYADHLTHSAVSCVCVGVLPGDQPYVQGDLLLWGYSSGAGQPAHR